MLATLQKLTDVVNQLKSLKITASTAASGTPEDLKRLGLDDYLKDVPEAIRDNYAKIASGKIAVFTECGIEVAVTPSDMADALLRAAKAKGVTLA
jgi:hypothetical protein